MTNVLSVASNSHVCCNHKGSASSMETIGAYRIFEWSENLRKLQYTDYYDDGDSKAYESVKNMYEPNTVNKLKCPEKGWESSAKVKKVSKLVKELGGKGKVTDNFINCRITTE